MFKSRVQVKTFSDVSLNDLSDEVNEFIESSCVSEIIDIKFQSDVESYAVMIIYRQNDNDPNDRDE